jgi:uncharacterized protein (UPF0261 family)
MALKILLIGTLDTKEEEFAFVKDMISANGCKAVVMNVGVLDDPKTAANITAAAVAEAGGGSLKELRNNRDREQALNVMTEGAKKLTLEWYQEGKIMAVLSLGGGSGTAMATAAMRELPVGVPKLMVSSLASGDVSPYVDIKDVTFMYSVADIAGLNRLSRKILSNAAGAICGMAQQKQTYENDKLLLAASMFGVTTPCVSAVREKLESRGYEVVVFHATGSGGRAMEAMIRDGFISGVADVTTTEWCDEVAGGVLSAGADRLEAAGQAGIPQVVSCGALDMVNFHAPDTVPEKYDSRNLYRHTPQVTLMRTTAEECREIGKRIAEKLNASTGPTILMLPLKGVSMMDKQGEPFYDPEADRALFNALREHAAPHLEIKELDYHINDPEFAEAVAKELLNLLD